MPVLKIVNNPTPYGVSAFYEMYRKHMDATELLGAEERLRNVMLYGCSHPEMYINKASQPGFSANPPFFDLYGFYPPTSPGKRTRLYLAVKGAYLGARHET